jgi:hypothetical protein
VRWLVSGRVIFNYGRVILNYKRAIHQSNLLTCVFDSKNILKILMKKILS